MDLGTPSFSKIPNVLQPSVNDVLDRLGGSAAFQKLFKKDDQFNESFFHVIPCSNFVADIMLRYPDHVSELVKSGRLYRSSKASELSQIFDSPGDAVNTERKKLRQLRLVRHRELLRIAWRDIAGWAGIEETLQDLSDLADAATCNALDWATEELSDRFGMPVTADGSAAHFIVLAMGKLGGGELNFSSDIDLVLLYSEPGETNGRPAVTSEQYFRSLAQQVINLLSKTTADGFVYRVDVRLRPFGDSGPLAISTAALEGYLMQHGRNWERYAYLKARVVNRWDGADAFYHETLRPFVYRRYLDYGVFSALREIKSQIEKEGRNHPGNIKIGPGGIREIEFIVQSLQLVRGGTIEGLRQRKLLKALPELVKHKCLTSGAATELEGSYKFLRKLENSIQEIADKQTHDLPISEIDQARVCLAMGYPDWDALLKNLGVNRGAVEQHFHDIILKGADDSSEGDADEGIRNLWSDELSDEAALDQLKQCGFSDADDSLKFIKRLRESSAYRRMDEIGRQRMDRLVPAVIRAAADDPVPGRALDGALQVIGSIGLRTAYLALLIENPAALNHLVGLSGKSKILAKQVAINPVLLDELLDPRIFTRIFTQAEISGDLRSRIAAVQADEPEEPLEAMRNFQQAAVFRVAVADLSGAFPVMKVSDQLTDIAEVVLRQALDIAWSELVDRYGSPFCNDDSGVRPTEFGIVAYGKLGGIELGYGSDLDLVFVHDSAGDDQQTDGKDQLDNLMFFSRLAKRVVNILTMQTLSGPLYEIDTRLRPSGRSGLLVTSLAAFERYQREDAWTWEHQALLRSRPVAGSATIAEAFNDVRIRVLRDNVRRDSLKDDVQTMRARMRSELSKGNADTFDVKQDAGGIGDIEFLVQYLVLKEAATNAGLLRYTDNIRQIEELQKAQIITLEEATLLSDVYRTYRESINRLSLASRPGLISADDILADEFSAFRESIQDLWFKYFAN